MDKSKLVVTSLFIADDNIADCKSNTTPKSTKTMNLYIAYEAILAHKVSNFYQKDRYLLLLHLNDICTHLELLIIFGDKVHQ